MNTKDALALVQSAAQDSDPFDANSGYAGYSTAEVAAMTSAVSEGTVDPAVALLMNERGPDRGEEEMGMAGLTCGLGQGYGLDLFFPKVLGPAALDLKPQLSSDQWKMAAEAGEGEAGQAGDAGRTGTDGDGGSSADAGAAGGRAGNAAGVEGRSSVAATAQHDFSEQLTAGEVAPNTLAASEEVVPCVRYMCSSAWNPPPPTRKLQGDLLYIEVGLLDTIPGLESAADEQEMDDLAFGDVPRRAAHGGHNGGADRAAGGGGGRGSVVQLTATSRGWYLNGCTNGQNGSQPIFAPGPRLGPDGRVMAAPELHALLRQLSPAFSRRWDEALTHAAAKARMHETPLELLAMMVGEGRIDTVIIRPQWCLPQAPLPLVCNTPLRLGGEADRDSSSSSDDVDNTYANGNGYNGHGKSNGHANGLVAEPAALRHDQVNTSL